MGIACSSGSGCCLQKQTNLRSTDKMKERTERVIKDNILLSIICYCYFIAYMVTENEYLYMIA